MPTPLATQVDSPLGTEEARILLEFLQSSEALLSGHFRLTSGLHSPNYLQCARLLMDPVRAEWCGQRLGRLVAGIRASWVLSPALGGLIIGHELARALGVPHLFAERKEGAMSIRRGFRVPPGEPFIAVEDVVTTGGSVQEAARVAQEQGGVLVGVCSILNRSGKANPFGEQVPFFSLLRMDFPTYTEEECPLCESGLAIDTPGSRKN